MIISDLSKIKIKTNIKILLKCDICGKKWTGLIQNYYKKEKHLCKSCIGKNRRHSEKTKEKIRNSLLGQKHTLQRIEKIRKALIGKKKSKKSIEKQIKTRKENGYFHTKETRKKISIGNKGHIVTEETRKKVSIGNKIYNEIHGNSFKGKKHKEKTKKIMSEKAKKRLKSNRIKLKIYYSKISQELFWKLYNIIKDDFKEIYFATLNQKTKKNTVKNQEYFIKTKRSIRWLDFYIKDINLAIEYIHDYWHNNYKDLKRELEIREVNPNIKIFYINNKDKNKIKKCLKEIKKYV